MALTLTSDLVLRIIVSRAYISPTFFEVGFPNLVCAYILGSWSVAYHCRVTVALILTSDLVFGIIVSGAYLLYFFKAGISNSMCGSIFG